MLNSGGLAETDLEARAMTALRALLQAGDTYRHHVATHFKLGWTELEAIGHLLGDEDIGQTDLARKLGITTGAATALVDRLERDGLAARHPHPKDRRRSMVRLSEGGYALVRMSHGWTRHAFDGLRPEETEQLAQNLLVMAANLKHQVEQMSAELVVAESEESSEGEAVFG